MIIDTLDNLARYESLYPLIAEVVAFMKSHDLESLEAGMHPIKGEVAYVNIQMAKGKTENEAAIEYHRKMIDIQLPLETASATATRHWPTCQKPTSMRRTILPCCPACAHKPFSTSRKGSLCFSHPKTAMRLASPTKSSSRKPYSK